MYCISMFNDDQVVPIKGQNCIIKINVVGDVYGRRDDLV